MESKLSKNREHHLQISPAFKIVGLDAIGIILSWTFALFCSLNFAGRLILHHYEISFAIYLGAYLLVSLLIYWQFDLYRMIVKFASYRELEHILMASLICLPLAVVIGMLSIGRMPVSFYVIGTVLQIFVCSLIRFEPRYLMLMKADQNHSHQNDPHSKSRKDEKNTMIIGAGSAGVMLLRDASHSDSNLNVICFIDDDPAKQHCMIDGVEVFGTREHILEAAEKFDIDLIVFAAPSADARDKKDILNICGETNCEIKTLPSLIELTTRNISVSNLKNIEMNDLLGRDPIKVDTDKILADIEGKTILVTGGGGSIGSELCRQIASHHPGQLLIFDIYENNAYEIQQELLRKYPDLNLKVLIGSVRDSIRLEQVFDKYHPQLVFHAAAHKHVPLMEVSPCESIKNNTIGTYKTARAAAIHGTERFVLISTDKAVNPTNIMGASKRLCEMVVQSMDYMASHHLLDSLPEIGAAEMHAEEHAQPTKFVMVRFGNVLGSNGSVIPLFKKQIEAGGPVTVTHPDIVRYFMTIPEAVSLVLQASAYAKGGEIFVLDMGEPVKIDDLARNLIRQMGLIPDEDIEISYTGLRPGEKLYEEKPTTTSSTSVSRWILTGPDSSISYVVCMTWLFTMKKPK